MNLKKILVITCNDYFLLYKLQKINQFQIKNGQLYAKISFFGLFFSIFREFFQFIKNLDGKIYHDLNKTENNYLSLRNKQCDHHYNYCCFYQSFEKRTDIEIQKQSWFFVRAFAYICMSYIKIYLSYYFNELFSDIFSQFEAH